MPWKSSCLVIRRTQALWRVTRSPRWPARMRLAAAWPCSSRCFLAFRSVLPSPSHEVDTARFPRAINVQSVIASMDLSAFEQACNEARKLVALSECLQDHLEDGRADRCAGAVGILDPECDLLLDLVAGIHGAGTCIVELIGRDFPGRDGWLSMPVTEEDLAVAFQEMLHAVTAVSLTCEHLRLSPLAREFALPDFSGLARTSLDLRLRLQQARVTPDRVAPSGRSS